MNRTVTFGLVRDGNQRRSYYAEFAAYDSRGVKMLSERVGDVSANELALMRWVANWVSKAELPDGRIVKAAL
jgi:hypothetical protein